MNTVQNELQYPNGDKEVVEYDQCENVVATKFNNEYLTYSYPDNDGKVTKYIIVKNGGGYITPTYDAADRMTNSGNGETFTYDKDGLVTQCKITNTNFGAIYGQPIEYSYAYKDNYAKDLETISFDGVTVFPQKDKAGRYTGKKLRRGNTFIAEDEISYRKEGTHATNMPSGENHGCVGSNGLAMKDDCVTYTYDARGNIIEIDSRDGMPLVMYTYDDIGRLVREDNAVLGKTMTFVYDYNGNIQRKRIYDFTTDPSLDGNTYKNYRYRYGGGTICDRMTSFGGENCVYDSMGRPTTYRGKAVTWERGRFVSSIGGTTFITDGEGKRTGKDILRFSYDSEGRLCSQGCQYYGYNFMYDHTGLIGVKHETNYGSVSSTYFYRKNIFGDITAILDKDGKVVVKYVYDAWGNHKVLDASGNEITDPSHIGNRNPFRYRSYYYDTETGLYYLKSRYYDPETGKFISADDLSYVDQDHVNGTNLYAYCHNNPITHIHSSGRSTFSITNRQKYLSQNSFVSQNSFNSRGIPFGNTFIKTSCTQLIWGVRNRWWGRFDYSITTLEEQTEETGFFYAYKAFDSGVISYGAGMNVFGWYGLEMSVDSEVNINANTTITPWFHYGASFGVNGLSISAGITKDGTSHDFTIGIGITPILVALSIVIIVVTGGQAIPAIIEWLKPAFGLA